MFTFLELDSIPNKSVDIVSEIEAKIIIKSSELFLGIKDTSRNDAINYIRRYASQEAHRSSIVLDREIEEEYNLAIGFTMQEETRRYIEAGREKPDYDYFLKSNLVSGIKHTQRKSKELISSLAKESFRSVGRYWDKAVLDIQSGLSYEEAISRAVKQLCNQGIKFVSHDSGRIEHIDSAIRRNVLTDINQLCGRMSLETAQEMGEDIMEISAHAGARESHAAFQGGLVSLSGAKGYLSLDDIGYGTPEGFKGLNCRHGWHVFFVGLSEPAYSEKELEDYKGEGIKYNGKEYNEYEASQKQRYIERQIRKWKREADAMEAAGLDNSYAVKKVRTWQAEQRDFINQTGLKRDYFRERAGKQNLEIPSKNDIIKQVRSSRFTKGNPLKPKVSKMSDTIMPHTVLIPEYSGATKLKDGVVPKGVKLKKINIIAGSGTSTPIRDTKRLDALYGGNPSGWKKLVGTVDGEYYRYEVHWYENNGFTHEDETKVRRWWEK